jgi:hypothetical protein
MSAAALAETSARMQRLEDIEAIQQLKAKYVRCVDTKQWQEWGQLLTEDCRLETEGGVHEGRDTLVKILSESMKEGVTVHRVTMPEITITGPDSAAAIWAMQDEVSLIYKGQSHRFRGFGYYHETYRRTPAGWQVKSSKLVRHKVEAAA